MSNALEVRNLSVAFHGIPVTDGLSFQVQAGENYALVGESGCGKSVTAMSILGLLPKPSGQAVQGEILWQGQDLLRMSPTQLLTMRGKEFGVIFQEPSQALNPILRIQTQMHECMPHESLATVIAKATILLQQAGITETARVLKAYPHELSGGMLQRVMIVMAMLANPQMLIADEPTTALDVTVQAQVMVALADLVRSQNKSLLLITHNLALVAQYADRVGVMYAGRLVEEGSIAQVLQHPAHPYTQALIAAVPQGVGICNLQAIAGNVPKPQDFVSGCRFADRCTRSKAQCQQRPPRRSLESQHHVECWYA